MAQTPEKVILGIDPGTSVLGYAALKMCGKKSEMIAMGVIDLRKCKDVYLKLGRILERVASLMDAFHPDEIAVEAPFCGKNVQSMLKLGRAQGVVIAAAMMRDIPIFEFAPLKIKQTVTGNGLATKEQVKRMLVRLMKLDEEKLLPYYDATDALAVAYCRHLESIPGSLASKTLDTVGTHKSKKSSWADFAALHPERINSHSTLRNDKKI
ncbi:MAG: crossover junction endodeoxyribonuclease RuvC [Alloprevotella sp.]